MIPLPPTTAAWFALRQQRRRRHNSNGNSNPSIPMPEDYMMRLRADSLGLSVGDPIPDWPDESGNGNDAFQDTVSMQPTMGEAVWAGNTFPVVRFDTVDDGMETGLVLDSDSPFSIFTLWRPTTFDVPSGALISSGSRNWSIGNQYAVMLCFFEDWSAFVPITAGAFYLIETRVDPGTSTLGIYLNGDPVAIDGGGCIGPDQVTLGASGYNGYPGNCECAEILAWDRFLSDPEAQAVRDYFQSQYNYQNL